MKQAFYIIIHRFAFPGKAMEKMYVLTARNYYN